MTSTSKRSPLVGKSVVFPFQIAVVCWIDLLGYGAMIAEADFNPLHPNAALALARLRRFHQIVAAHSARYFPTLVVNDGAAAYRDLSLRSRAPTHDFLMRAWKLFNSIKKDEIENGFPGARMVLASGFRMRGRRAGIDSTTKQFESVMRRYQSGEITAKQAISEAASVKRSFDIVPQLQANFAFSKAYVAERSGTRGGLGGANFFVDLALFERPTLAWIEKGAAVEWSDKKLHMTASFAPVLDFPRFKHVEGGPLGIRDGLQIAQYLTQDPDVLTALRTAGKPR
jgi:hypothetical protein